MISGFVVAAQLIDSVVAVNDVQSAVMAHNAHGLVLVLVLRLAHSAVTLLADNVACAAVFRHRSTRGGLQTKNSPPDP